MVLGTLHAYTRMAPRDDSIFFVDDLGTGWQVFELLGAGGSPSLIFESDMALRRIRKYPPDWRDLSTTEFLRLSWAR
jgi:hypothetical protein